MFGVGRSLIGTIVGLSPLIVTRVVHGPELPIWIAFGGVGLAILLSGLTILVKFGLLLRRARSRPTAPWTWSPGWVRNLYRPSQPLLAHTAHALLAAFGNAVAFAGLLLIAMMWMNRWPWDVTDWILFVILAIVAVTGVVLGERGIRQFVAAWHWRSCSMQLSRIPGEVGGRLTAIVELTDRAREVRDLECVLRMKDLSSRGRPDLVISARDWNATHRRPPGLPISVEFEIPSSASETSFVSARQWFLQIQGRHRRSMDLHIGFGPLPVFRTMEQQEPTGKATPPPEPDLGTKSRRHFEWKPVDTSIAILILIVEGAAAAFVIHRLLVAL